MDNRPAAPPAGLFDKGFTVSRFLLLLLVLLSLAGCSPAARSEKSFDEIRTLVVGKTEAEVTKLLGNPDHREKLPISVERLTWWNYTYLGKDWAPEVRGKVVHLEITFAGSLDTPVGDDEPSRWRVSEPYGVWFFLPGGLEGSPPLNKTPTAVSKGI